MGFLGIEGGVLQGVLLFLLLGFSLPFPGNDWYGWDGSPRQAEHGSIIVIHMPERGFRDWCLRGVDCFCDANASSLLSQDVSQLVWEFLIFKSVQVQIYMCIIYIYIYISLYLYL